MIKCLIYNNTTFYKVIFIIKDNISIDILSFKLIQDIEKTSINYLKTY